MAKLNIIVCVFLKLLGPLGLLFFLDIPGFVATFVRHEWWAGGGCMVVRCAGERGKSVFWPDFIPPGRGHWCSERNQGIFPFYYSNSHLFFLPQNITTDQFDLISPLSVDWPTLVFQCFSRSCFLNSCTCIYNKLSQSFGRHPVHLKTKQIWKLLDATMKQPLPWPWNLQLWLWPHTIDCTIPHDPQSNQDL